MKTILFIFFITILLVLSCDPAENKLQIINNSDKDIYCFYSCDSLPKDIFILRNDYYRSNGKDSVYMTSNNFIKAKSSLRFVQRGYNAWNRHLNTSDGKIYIYYFDDTIIENNMDEEIFSKKMYLKRVKYTLEDLEKSNWTVTYP